MDVDEGSAWPKFGHIQGFVSPIFKIFFFLEQRPIKLFVCIKYTDPKWKLYIVFKSVYFDNKLSFEANFFGHRIFNVLSMSVKKQIGWKSNIALLLWVIQFRGVKMKISKNNYSSHTDFGSKKLLAAWFKWC